MPEPPTSTPDYAPPEPHDPIEELFEDVFWVHGSISIQSAGPDVHMNRNMVVLRQAGELTVISPVRLTPDGEAALDALGAVRHVVRIGYFHGVDDRYYVDRYAAEFWCQAGSDFHPEPKPTQVLTESTTLPVDGAELFVFRETRFPESAVLLHRHGGLLVTGDSVQNHADWSYCSAPAQAILEKRGFELAMIVGPPWRQYMTPESGSLHSDFERLLRLDFDHQIGAHGVPCRGGGRERLRAAVASAFSD